MTSNLNPTAVVSSSTLDCKLTRGVGNLAWRWAPKRHCQPSQHWLVKRELQRQLSVTIKSKCDCAVNQGSLASERRLTAWLQVPWALLGVAHNTRKFDWMLLVAKTAQVTWLMACILRKKIRAPCRSVAQDLYQTSSNMFATLFEQEYMKSA
jgi:hypothetical protein